MTLISALTAVTTPALADEYEIEQAGASFKITGTQIMNLLAANISLAAARITSGTLVPSRGGTGISNADANTLTLGGATSITGGGTLALGGFTLTVPATGSAALLAVANVFTAAQTGQRDGIGAVSTDGLILTNATAAAAGAQQQSPRLRLTGQGWKTNATAASQTIDWAIEAVPVQGAANPTSQLLFRTQINAGGYSAAGYFSSDLSLNLNGVLNATSTVNITGVTNLLTNSIRIVQTDNMYQFGNGSGVYDTALKRNAAGVVEVNNGTMGQWGALKAGTRDSATNTTSVGLTLGHQSTGTPAASFGIGLKMALNSDTTADQDAAQIEARWTTATHASRSSKLDLSVVQSAGALTSRMTVNDGANAAGVYIPWISGDSLCSLFVGSANASNNQIAIQGQTASNVGVYGYASAANGTGLKGESGSGIGLSTTVSNSAGTSSLFESTAALTTTVHTAFLKRGNSSGTPAAGYGLTSQTQLKSSTTTNQAALDETVTWSTATHASRKARVVWSIYDTASREVLRGEASGSAPMIGFLGANAAARQASGADLTNNVSSGGTDDTIANFTDLTVYANDSAAIRNDIYQLARKLKQVNDALRLYGLLT